MVIDSGSNRYNRSNSSPQIKLEQNISERYGSRDFRTLITTSGMQAVYASIYSVTTVSTISKVNLIHAHELYCDVPRLFRHFTVVDVNSTSFTLHEFTVGEDMVQLFSKRFQGQDNILYFESCSNPNGHIFNFDVIPKLRELSKTLIVVVDNTWLSSCIFNPFSYGADIVVTSLTKYYGASSAICGAAVFRHKPLYEAAEMHLRFTGVHVSPYNASLILKNIEIVPKLYLNNYNSGEISGHARYIQFMSSIVASR